MHLRQITIGPELPDGSDCRPQLLIEPVRKAKPGFDETISIGRTEDNDIMLEDVQVSKLHALMTMEGTRVTVQDAGSLNGTFVGTQRIYRRTVRAKCRSAK